MRLSFSIALIYTVSRWIPASASANQGTEKGDLRSCPTGAARAMAKRVSEEVSSISRPSLYEKGIEMKLSGNEVYYTACSLLVILKYSCCRLHRQFFLD